MRRKSGLLLSVKEGRIGRILREHHTASGRWSVESLQIISTCPCYM